MLIENQFTVRAPVGDLWAYLLDVERVAPCLPGAELTETLDDRSWKGRVNLKFGPVSMSFAGTVRMTERDDQAHRVVLLAKGVEQKGKGAATATVTSWLEPASSDGETIVHTSADISLTGAAAQLSRGLLPEVSKKLTQQFVDCLQASMAAEQPAATAAEQPAATATEHPATAPVPRETAGNPVAGLRLGLGALWSLITGFFRRLFRTAP
jgi:carbon monoxide dehydrogenase subunit G